MNPDKYQQAWQGHSSQTRITVHADLLLKEVQRNQRNLQSTILRRDVLEVAVGLLLLPYWIYKGLSGTQPWTWWLGVPAIIWMVGFFVIDRIRHPQKPSDPGEPLLSCVKNSLTQVEHQIWLLRNVFWWYLMPFTIAIQTFFAHTSWTLSKSWLGALGTATPFFFFLVALYAFIDFLNQHAVRSNLEPRRQELLTLLASLGGDGSTEEQTATSSESSTEYLSLLRRWFIVLMLSYLIFMVMMLVLPGATTDTSFDQPAKIDGPAGPWLGKLVTDLRKEKNLVGLAAMVTVDGQLKAAAAQGQRKIVSGVPLEITDRFHLGGITKSITATMIARLVESGKLKWTDTVGEIFPDASIHDDWKPVTLRQILTDTAGAPAYFPKEIQRQRPPLGPQRTQARRETVLKVINDKPASPPGKKYAYSNVGYTIAGAMAEKVTGETWEDLVTREVFEPLGLVESGFGPPKSSDETLEQPRGHRQYDSGKFPADDKADNSPIMGPSGMIHMSLRDLCTYANEHLLGEQGKGKLLSAGTYKLLHTPELQSYACGWIKNQPKNALSNTSYWHNGSNTMWYAYVEFIPDKHMVVAVAANDGDSAQAALAAYEIASASVNHFDAESDSDGLQSQPSEAFPKKSPFAAVRWQVAQPEVKIGDQWFKLISLDDLRVTEIIAFSQRSYGNRWQMRFEEDLVELLTRMGHTPNDTVRLVVSPLGSSKTQILDAVPMTEANRRAIKAAAQARESSQH